MRILITGMTGFVGSHLAEALCARSDVEVHGASRSGRWSDDLNYRIDRATLHQMDLCDAAQTVELLKTIAPERIYHVAGYAATGRSFQELLLPSRDLAHVDFVFSCQLGRGPLAATCRQCYLRLERSAETATLPCHRPDFLTGHPTGDFITYQPVQFLGSTSPGLVLPVR